MIHPRPWAWPGPIAELGGAMIAQSPEAAAARIMGARARRQTC